jgi:hypothetical protein
MVTHRFEGEVSPEDVERCRLLVNVGVVPLWSTGQRAAGDLDMFRVDVIGGQIGRALWFRAAGRALVGISSDSRAIAAGAGQAANFRAGNCVNESWLRSSLAP